LVQLDVDLTNVWSLDIDVMFDDDIASILATALTERGIAPLVPMKDIPVSTPTEAEV